MANATGRAVVGQLGIKVTPDFADFHAKLKSYLQGVRSSTELNIKTDVKITKASLAEARREIKSLGDDINVKINARDLGSTLTRIRQQIEQQNRAEAKKSVAAARQQARQYIDELNNKPIHAKAAEHISEALRKARADLGDLRDNIKVNVKAALESDSVQSVKARLATLRDDIRVKVDTVLDHEKAQKIRAHLLALKEHIRVKVDAVVDSSAFVKAKSLMKSVGDNVRKVITPVLNTRALSRVKAAMAGIQKPVYKSVHLKLSAGSAAVWKTFSRSVSKITSTIKPVLAKSAHITRLRLEHMFRSITLRIRPLISKPQMLAAMASMQALRISVVQTHAAVTALHGGFNRLFRAIGAGSALQSALYAVNRFAGIVITLAGAGVLLAPLIAAPVLGAMSHLATTALALGDGLKKASGAALLIPGLIASASISAIGLAGAVAGIKREFKEYGDVFKNLFKGIGDTAMVEAKDSIKHLLDTMIPHLENGFGVLAQVIGRLLAAVADTLAKPENVAQIRLLFGNIAWSIEKLTPAFVKLTDMLVMLASASAQFLPLIADYINKVVAAMHAWLVDSVNSNAFFNAVFDAFDVMRDLLRLTQALFNIVRGLLRAMAAGNFITFREFVNSVVRLSNVINSSNVQAKIAELFGGARDALAIAAPAWRDLFNTMVDGIPTFVVMMKQAAEGLSNLLYVISGVLGSGTFAQGLQNFFNSATESARMLIPVVPQISRLFSTLFTEAGQALETVTSTVAHLLVVLEPALQRLVTGFTDAVSIVAKFITELADHPGMSDGIIAIIDGIVNALRKLAEAAEPIGDIFIVISKTLGPSLLSLATGIVDFITNMQPQLELLVISFGAIMSAVGKFMSAMSAQPAFAEGIEAVIEGVLNAVDSILKSVEPLAELIGTLGTAFGSLLSQSFENLSTILQASGDEINEIILIIADGLGVLMDAIVQLVSNETFMNGLQAFFSGLTQFVKDLLPVIPQVAKFLGTMGEALGQLFGGGVDANGKAVEGIGKSIAEALEKILPLMSEVLPPLIPPLMDLIKKVAEVFTDEQVLENIKTIFESVTEALPKITEHIGDIIREGSRIFAGISKMLPGIIDGIGNGLTYAFKGVIKVVQSVGKYFEGFGTFVSGIIGYLINLIRLDFPAAFKSLHKAFLGSMKMMLAGIDIVWNAIKAIAEAISGVLFPVLDRAASLLGHEDNWFKNHKSFIPEANLADKIDLSQFDTDKLTIDHDVDNAIRSRKPTEVTLSRDTIDTLRRTAGETNIVLNNPVAESDSEGIRKAAALIGLGA